MEKEKGNEGYDFVLSVKNAHTHTTFAPLTFGGAMALSHSGGCEDDDDKKVVKFNRIKVIAHCCEVAGGK